MPLHANNLLDPEGELEADVLWPGKPPDEVDEIIETYLTAGYALAADAVAGNQDEAARQWAYHRAYKSAYTRLLAMPSTVATSDQGSASYLLTQIEHVGELADVALTAHEGLVSVTTGAVAVAMNMGSESRSFVSTW